MKTTSWTAIKQIIGDNNSQTDLFLTLINENGFISCANATMIKDLEIKNPRLFSTNFFDLIHPFNLDEFKNTLRETTQSSQATGLELYIKNGIYHPMKWQVSCLTDLPDLNKTYLCVGYKIADDERMRRFNRLLKDNCHLIIEGLNGVIFHDVNGDLIAINQKVASIFGTTLENLYQLKNIEELWKNQWTITNESGLPVPFEETPFVKAAKTRRLQTQTLIIRLRNGEDRWILFNCQPLLEEEINGQFPVVSNIIDVTSERQLSNRLKEREAIICAFLQETPDLAWVIDEDAHLHFASNAFYRHFGINEKDCLSKRVTDMVPPAVTRTVFENHIKVFETGKPVQASEKIKWADGSQSVSHIHLFPIKNVSGKKLVGGQAINVVDKGSLEKELKDARERFLNFSRATSDAIWEWDMQSGQIFRNEALMEMIGYQPDNSKGLSWWLRRIHPEDRNRLADKIKEATDNVQQSWQDQYRFKCADGSYKHIQDKGFVVYENGLPVKMIGSLQNVSSIKELKNELADVRLQRQKEISETIIKVQEKERSRIGHELHDNVNQLLSTIKLFFGGINTSNTEQKQLKSKSIEYLHMAIEEITKLSKELVTPQLKEENLTNNIKALIEDIQLAGTLKFSLIHDIDDKLLSSGKKITLFRIVQEQLKNIIKHSRATNIQISLQTKDDHVILVMKDNGKGFDPQQTRQGIGLSNIHERAQFYNGMADIKSPPGAGCTLTVTIPVKEN
ncbi:MAG: PAS domain-containing protein [Chitinophagaceae bacterium]